MKSKARKRSKPKPTAQTGQSKQKKTANGKTHRRKKHQPSWPSLCQEFTDSSLAVLYIFVKNG